MTKRKKGFTNIIYPFPSFFLFIQSYIIVDIYACITRLACLKILSYYCNWKKKK